MTNTELIDELIANLEAEVRIASERLRTILELRDTWNVTPIEVAPTPNTPPPRTNTPEPSRPASARDEERRARDRERKRREREGTSKPTRQHAQVTCPDCGQVMGSAAGLGMHRKSKHPESAAKPIEPLRSVPTKPQIEGKVLRCTCGEELANFKALIAHTHDVHERDPMAIERTPVTPRAVA